MIQGGFLVQTCDLLCKANKIMNKLRKKKNKIRHKAEKGMSKIKTKKRDDINKLPRLIKELEKVLKDQR